MCDKQFGKKRSSTTSILARIRRKNCLTIPTNMNFVSDCPGAHITPTTNPVKQMKAIFKNKNIHNKLIHYGKSHVQL